MYYVTDESVIFKNHWSWQIQLDLKATWKTPVTNLHLYDLIKAKLALRNKGQEGTLVGDRRGILTNKNEDDVSHHIYMINIWTHNIS